MKFQIHFLKLFLNQLIYQLYDRLPIYILGGAGIGKSYFKIEKQYGIPLREGGTLSSIRAEGSNFSTCISLGIKYEFTKSLELSLVSNYTITPKMNTKIETGDNISVDLKNFSSSLRFSVGF